MFQFDHDEKKPLSVSNHHRQDSGHGSDMSSQQSPPKISRSTDNSGTEISH